MAGRLSRLTKKRKNFNLIYVYVSIPFDEWISYDMIGIYILEAKIFTKSKKMYYANF